MYAYMHEVPMYVYICMHYMYIYMYDRYVCIYACIYIYFLFFCMLIHPMRAASPKPQRAGYLFISQAHP